MHSLKKSQPRSAYLTWLQQLADYGEPVEVRGHKTLELLDCVTEITEPWHHCILIPSRRWNPFLALSEALWILAGRDDVAALKPYNSHITDYSDDGVHLYGAYGKRIYSQIDPLVERLKKDPSDRRAVLQIWDQHKYGDLNVISKDPPCNNMVYFKLRQSKLHMTVINRSNDLHFGLFAVNLPTFGILQSYIAARLGVEMGTQTHFSNSLHIYTDEKRAAEITDRMLYRDSEDMPVYPTHDLVFKSEEFEHLDSHVLFSELCSLVLDGKEPTTFAIGKSEKYPVPNFLIFAASFLKAYREKSFHPEEIPYSLRYFDWTLAGDMFVPKAWKK